MSKFHVVGGSPLEGVLSVQGSKNAAFPVIAAALLTEETCEIDNVPEIDDVKKFVSILEKLGCDVSFEHHRLRINSGKVEDQDLLDDEVRRFRGSILLAGVMLSRFSRVKMYYPGGCTIGERPIDVHVDGFRKLGAEVVEHERHFEADTKGLRGNKIVLGVTSVTGTENLILASVLAEGRTEIRLAATEPHVQDLCRFLNKMGAKIEGVGTPNLVIEGVKKLKGAKHKLCSDEIAAVTYAVAAAATKGEVKLTHIDTETLDAPLAAMIRMGVNLEADKDCLYIKKPQQEYQGTRIITGVFPQLLTDQQPLFSVLATQAVGETSIHDWIYEGRQGHLKILEKMGARVQYDDVHRARINGPTKLKGAEVKSPDLRAGATLLIAALVAEGESVIYNAEMIDRGYERFGERLKKLGAEITRVD